MVLLMMAGSVKNARTAMGVEQGGHLSPSTSRTWRSNGAQPRWRGRGMTVGEPANGVTGGSSTVPTREPPPGGAGRKGRSLDLFARTPWYRVRLW